MSTASVADPRRTYRWRQIRARLVAAATHCALCGGLLAHDAPGRSRWSPALDHVLPLAHGGQPFAADNLRVVHYSCNSSRAARIRNGLGDAPTPAPTPARTRRSRTW